MGIHIWHMSLMSRPFCGGKSLSAWLCSIQKRDTQVQDCGPLGFLLYNLGKIMVGRIRKFCYLKAAVSQIFTELWLKIVFHQKF